jgi:arginine decarboxylase
VSREPTTARRAPAARFDRPASGLTIQVVSGIGFGPTKLAAFDAALRQGGIANFNLVYMSSIIPSGSTVVVADGDGPAGVGGWGDRLYAVMAELRIDTAYEEAVAGLGWAQSQETGQGLFVEHTGHTEREVERDILATLDALCTARPDTDFGPPHLVMRRTVCAGEPTCALVAAVFEADAWRGGDTEIPLP